MRNLLQYWLCSFCCLLVVKYAYAETDRAREEHPSSFQERLIHTFRDNLGFVNLSEYGAISWDADSLLTALDEAKYHPAFFELGRIVAKINILKGEMRLAAALGERLYSRAKVSDDPRALALSLNTLGEVYIFTGKKEEAGEALEKAYDLFSRLPEEKEGPLMRILLLELTEYYLGVRNFEKADRYLSLLNHFPVAELSVQAQIARNVFNIYYRIAVGDLEGAGHYRQAIDKLPEQPMVGIWSYYTLANAVLFEKQQELGMALQTYDVFLKSQGTRNNALLYSDALKRKAEVWENLGRKEEAFQLYNDIYIYSNAIFKKNYPKEINRLTARFRAEQLTYQNEKNRHLSIRYFTFSIVACVLLLLIFLLLGWKRIFVLRQSKLKQEKMQRKAEEAIQRKNLFLSNMSHEVRTPLNAIVGFADLLTMGGISEDERREYCKIIEANSRQLLRLINDILDFSDFDGENLKFNIKEHDVVKVCREVVETVHASYQVRVDLRFETSLPSLCLETDDSRLRQVLINLLVNATKFTSKGSILLSLRLCPDDESTALFSVTDTGCGIPPEKQKLIFERFEKLNDQVQGSGLGLSICNLIIKHIHGKLWIDPDYTEGTRFYFTHPLKYNVVS